MQPGHACPLLLSLALPLLCACVTVRTATTAAPPAPAVAHAPAAAGQPGTTAAGVHADFIDRPQPDLLRLLNWNVRLGSVVAPDGVRVAPFERIVRATRPDVVVLQEILLPGHRARMLEAMQALMPDATWQMHAVADNLVLSRFPLLRRDGEEVIANPVPRLGLPDFRLGHAGVLIDLPVQFGERDLYLFAIHNKSRGGQDNIDKRQRHADAMMRALCALRDGTLRDGTPIVIAGDLNVLAGEAGDPRRHLATLLSGDIVDEAAFGPDCAPDWDGSALRDALPRHNATGPDDYTWRIDQTPYPPGALDRILYTDSVLRVAHGFVLDTTAMTDAQLERAGLRRDDVLFEATPGFYDHLPMVIDFALAGGR